MTDHTPTPEAQTVADALMRSGVAQPLAAQCAHHFDLMVRWNRVHNLTRITSATDAAHRHYLDCILAVQTIAEQVQEIPTGWADIGSGAGFPGIVAAAVWQRRGRLVEPAKKRASFLADVGRRLSLPVEVETVRVQEMEASPLVVSRATLPWREAEPAFAHVSPGGILALLVSEDSPEDEWRALAAQWGAVRPSRHSYALPGGVPRAVLLASRQQ